MSTEFYKAFEEKFRGNRDLVKARLRCYLPFILPLKTAYPQGQVLDLGCGRGEWLELLKEHGLQAVGVDLDEAMLDVCNTHHLDVKYANAIKYLESLPSQSQTVISAFHLVEHLPFNQLRSLVEEALRVLSPAGLLIMETPNPENLFVASYLFYLDPTHKRPLPPELLAFLPEYYGFERVKILRLQESNELVNQKIKLLDVIKGVSPDYAVIAQKAADADMLCLEDNAFATEFGLSLEHLAVTYHQQIEDIAVEAAHMVEQVEKKMVEIESTAKRTELRAKEVEIRAELTEMKTKKVESGSERSELRLTEFKALSERAEARAKIAEAKAECAEMRAQEAELRVQEVEFKTKALELKLESFVFKMTSFEGIKTNSRGLEALLKQREQELNEAHTRLHDFYANSEWLQTVIREHQWKEQIAEQRAHEAEMRLQELTMTSSKRQNKVLQNLAHLSERLSSGILFVPKRFKGYLKLGLAHIILYIKCRPRLRRFVVRMTSCYPGLKTHSVKVLAAAQLVSGVNLQSLHGDQSENLSHRTKTIYCQLKLANEHCSKD